MSSDKFLEILKSSLTSKETKHELVSLLRDENNLELRKELALILDKSNAIIPKLGNAMYQAGFWFCSKNNSDDLGPTEFNDRKKILREKYPIFNEVFAFMEFHYQLDNGGIEQWVDNGYCTDYTTLSILAKRLGSDIFTDILEEIYYYLDHKAIRNETKGISYWRKDVNLNTDEIEEIRASRKELDKLQSDLPKDLERTFDEYLFETVGDFHETIERQGLLKNKEISYGEYIHKLDFSDEENALFVAAWFVVHPDDFA